MGDLDPGYRSASPEAARFSREASLHAPSEWASEKTHRIREPGALASGLNDVLIAFRRPSKKYLLNLADSQDKVGLRFEVPSFGPCLYFVSGEAGGAVGAVAAHMSSILGCGGTDISSKTGSFFGDVSWGAAGAGHVFCTCGNGVDPGAQLLGNSDPGGLSEELENCPRR